MNDQGEITLLVVPEDPPMFEVEVRASMEDGDEDIFLFINGRRHYLKIHEVST